MSGASECRRRFERACFPTQSFVASPRFRGGPATSLSASAPALCLAGTTKQINSHWRQWVDNTTLQPDNHTVHFGTNNAIQHIKAALRHRLFRDNLLANGTPSMATKYRDVERRALQVFHGDDDPNPPLGALPAALQDYLYCLAHPSANRGWPSSRFNMTSRLLRAT